MTPSSDRKPGEGKPRKILTDPELALPSIPNYLRDPVIFEDKHLGIVMVADWCTRIDGKPHVSEDKNWWVFRLHNDHWCSERRATSADMMTVKSLIFLAKTEPKP